MENRTSKEEIVKGVKYRYSTDWIYSLESETHWRLYWHQQKSMQGRVLPGERVLEIGVGSGFTANYLRSKGVEVVTLDIDPEKRPDIVANIVVYDFDDEFDHILAFEVFEHIPYNEFEIVIKKLSKVCRQFLFLSVPQNEFVLFRSEFKIPKLRDMLLSISLPRRKFMAENHFWELNHKDTPAIKFETSLRNTGFTLITREVWFSRAFYILKKTTKENQT